MISIIISSIDEELLKNVTENIKQTIGVEFEIISFNNSNGELGLCKLYNEGAQSAKYDLLCFMHEDVNINTQDWGNILNNTFKANPNLGLIGLAGSTYKTLVPSGWFCDAGAKKVNYINILQRYKFNETATNHVYQNIKQEKLSKVIVVDGVWFCTKKNIVAQYPFDEHTFKKFHCYDLDFSLNVSQSYDVAVTFEVLLTHFSEGNYDRTWIDETLKLHNKWGNYLSKDFEGLTKKEKFIAEKYSFRVFLKQMLLAGYSKWQIFRIFWNSHLRKQNFVLFIKLLKEIKRA